MAGAGVGVMSVEPGLALSLSEIVIVPETVPVWMANGTLELGVVLPAGMVKSAEVLPEEKTTVLSTGPLSGEKLRMAVPAMSTGKGAAIAICTGNCLAAGTTPDRPEIVTDGVAGSLTLMVKRSE